jgi:predicted heme/steroid binding protein
MANDSSGSDLSSRLNTHVPHSARIWNYLLGGKDNFEAGRSVAEQVKQQYPDIVDIVDIVVAGRAFLGRAVRFLAGEAGVRQFRPRPGPWTSASRSRC